ncbi:MAG: hypothetical protein Q4D98_06855 [Planctomycetia bacterium]|nr:hypothetical protein [Planctomycetia bacterium]
MKAKLDTESLKELCLNHVEKVVFVLFVVFFLMTVWSSLGMKGLSRKPTELSRLVTSAEENLKQDQPVVTPIEDYLTMVETITTPILVDDLQTPAVWNPPLFPALKKREEPAVFTVEDLRIVSGRGKVTRATDMNRRMNDPMDADDEDEAATMMEEMPTSTTMGVRYCILTGAIPYKKQMVAFEDSLGGISQVKTARDIPTYFMYQVERAEVPMNGDTTNLKWEKLDITPKGNNYKIAKEIGVQGSMGRGGGSGMGGELDMMYDPPELMRYPSAKTDGTNPRMPRAEYGGMNMGPDDRGLIPMTSLSLSNPLPPVSASGSATINWNRIIEYPDGIDITKKSKKKKVIKKVKAQDSPDEEVPAEEDELGSEFAEVEEDNEGMYQQEIYQTTSAPVRLFRFVDYTVLPGVQYTYRVKLILHNPNYMYKPSHHVANEEITKSKYLTTDWSKPSPVVAVVRDERFLVGGTEMVGESITDKNKTPMLSLMLIRFNEETGDEQSAYLKYMEMDTGKFKRVKGDKKPILYKQPFVAGQKLTLSVHPSEMTSLTGMDMSMPMREMGPNGQPLEEYEEDAQKFDTGFLLLDVQGGTEELYGAIDLMKEKDSDAAVKYAQAIKAYPDAIYSPSRVLLMNPDGDLLIQSELADLQEVFPRVPKVDTNLREQELDRQRTLKESKSKKKNKKDGMIPEKSSLRGRTGR